MTSALEPRSRATGRGAMASLRAIAVIAGKDLRLHLRTGTLALFGVVLPLGLAFLFTTLIGGASGGFSATYAVADLDGGPLARSFVEEVLLPVSESTDGDIDIEAAPTAEVARQRAEDSEVSAAFVIPAGFSETVQAGDPVTLEVIGNADASIGTEVARAIAEAYTSELDAIRLAVALTAAEAPEADPQLLAERAQRSAMPVVLAADETAANRVLAPDTYYAAGMAVFFLFFTSMISVSGILEERSQGTMARLLATPTTRPIILIGKLTAGVLVGIAAMTVLVGSSTLLLGAQWGDLRGVALLLVAVVLAATGLMALAATFARTSEQATNWMSVAAVLLGLFGGSFVPLAQLGALGTVSYLTPHRWFLLGLSDLAGGDLGVVLLPVLALLGFAAVGFGLALLRVSKVVKP